MGISNHIWYERYRPQSFDDLVLSESVRESFGDFLENKTIPHLLLYGPPGSGKTSIANILIKNIPSKCLTLNASSKDRGVETVKTTITDFAKSKTSDGKIKIVFLDEADGLTPDAQFALKNTIETYQQSCRFILTANVVGMVRKEIRSRCMQFSFDQFPLSEMVVKLNKILRSEGIEFDRKTVSTLVNRLYPDFRSIVNAAQAGSISGKLKLTKDSGLGIKLGEFTEKLNSGDLRGIREACGGLQDFAFLYRYLFDSYIGENIDDDQKPEIALIVGEHARNDGMVVDKEINFSCCLLAIMMERKSKIKF